MKRGGILLLIIILLIVILSIAAFFVLTGGLGGFGGPGVSPEPVDEPVRITSTIVVLTQPVARDSLITSEMLEEIPYPEENITVFMFRTKSELQRVDDEGRAEDIYFAKYPLVQGQPLTRELVSDRPGIVQEGSQVARTIPPGMTAISIPISRLSAVGFAIRDGDFVNIIATTTFVDLDATFQSILPNSLDLVTGPAPLGTEGGAEPKLTISTGAGIQGRAELEPTLGQAIYLLPSEPQRPRLVSQMILQNIQVLHIGLFNLRGDQISTPAPVEGEDGEQQSAPPPPDIITLIVSPQDAISLTYLLHSKADLTLTLRAPDDPNILVDPESVTLQYLISQYNIALPAKLPFGMNPRIDDVAPEDEFAP
jgi:Flp pilus assembly protein CpaB